MAHSVDAHDANLVGDLVDHTLVAGADAIVVFAARQFATARRAWVGCQRLDRRDDVVVSLGRKSGEFLFHAALKQDAIHGHLRLRPAT